MDKLTSRKEKRKAAWHEKKQHKHQASVHYQKSRKQKESFRKRDLKDSGMKARDISLSDSDSDQNEGLQGVVMSKGHYAQNLKARNGKNKVEEENQTALTETGSDSDGDNLLAVPVVSRKMSGRDGSKAGVKKTKFEEYIEMETKTGISFEEDLETERRLAKKLKVKHGKLRDDDDGLNFLFEGISSVLDLSEQEDMNYDREMENDESTDEKKRPKKKKRKKSKRSDKGHVSDNVTYDGELSEKMSLELDEEGDINAMLEEDSEAQNIENAEKKKSKKKKRKSKKSSGENGSDDGASSEQQANDISSHLSDPDEEFHKDSPFLGDVAVDGVQGSGKYLAPHLRSKAGDNSQEYLQIRRRVRGLLNRLSESNVESITGEITAIYQSVSRAVASQIINEEVLASCSGGPRGNEQFQILRDLIPHGDQKRDTASFLLEVLDYVQLLQEKVQKYEGSYQGWSTEPTKLMPWRHSHWRVQSFLGHPQTSKNGPSPSAAFSGKFDEKGAAISPGVIANAQIGVDGDFNRDAFRSLEQPLELGDKTAALAAPLEVPMTTTVRTDGDVSHLPQRPVPDTLSSPCPLSRSDQEEEHMIEGGTISISSAYSHGLLMALTQALQSSGVDLSQASVSIRVDLGKRASLSLAPGTSSSKEHDQPVSRDLKIGRIGNESCGEALEQPQKKMRS